MSFRKWKQRIQDNGFEQRLRQGDLQTAVRLYNGNTGEKTLKYFETVNPQIAAQIRQMLAKNK